MKKYRKRDFPVEEIRRFLEPGECVINIPTLELLDTAASSSGK